MVFSFSFHLKEKAIFQYTKLGSCRKNANNIVFSKLLVYFK